MKIISKISFFYIGVNFKKTFIL